MIRLFQVMAYGTTLNLIWASISFAQNDDFADRIDLGNVFSISVTGTNVGYTGEPGEPGQPVPITSAWWQWTAPAFSLANGVRPANGFDPRVVIVDTFGSDFDTFLTLTTGTAVDALTVLANNDDAGGTLQSRIVFDGVVGGTVYNIAVDGFADQTGNIVLNINPVPEPSTLSLATFGLLALGLRRHKTGVELSRL